MIEGYNIIRRDRKRHAGGVCIYIKHNIECNLHSIVDPNNIEALCLDIKKENCKSFSVLCCYRPPSSDNTFFTSLEAIIAKLDSSGNEIILMGDLNCNLLASNPNSNTRILNYIAELFQLHQLLKEPTRITESSRTLIDVIYTNNIKHIVDSGIIHLGISDHSLVYVIRKISVPTKFKHRYITYRSFRKFNSSSFKEDLSQLPWETLADYSDPNLMWAKWKELFLTVANKHAPIKSGRVRNKNSPWINSEIRKLIIDRDCLKKQAIKTSNRDDWIKFKKVKNKTNRIIKETKANYYKSNIDSTSGNPRAIWKTLNELMGRNDKSAYISHPKYCSNPISQSMFCPIFSSFLISFIVVPSTSDAKLIFPLKKYASPTSSFTPFRSL